MTYDLDVDVSAQAQIEALPPRALPALTRAFDVLRHVPWSGDPYSDDKPDGVMRTLPFGSDGFLTYLIVEDRRRVDILVISWAG